SALAPLIALPVLFRKSWTLTLRCCPAPPPERRSRKSTLTFGLFNSRSPASAGNRKYWYWPSPLPQVIVLFVDGLVRVKLRFPLTGPVSRYSCLLPLDGMADCDTVTGGAEGVAPVPSGSPLVTVAPFRSEEHTSELQSREN